MTKLRPFVPYVTRFLVVFVSAIVCSSVLAQSLRTDLPDAPSAMLAGAEGVFDQSQPPAAAQSHQDPHQDPQQKRIFGILPNFRSVTAGTVLPPQTVKDKFVTATEDSFDYTSLILASAVAGEAYVANDTPEFQRGWPGYGRYLWHSYVDQTSENYLVEFIIPAMTHEDTRFYSLGRGSGMHRAVYAISRLVITRKDNGDGSTFNAGEVVGAAISSGISNFYYPRPERSVGNTLDKYGVNLGIDGASFVFREFYPDIYHAMFHQHVAAQSRP